MHIFSEEFEKRWVSQLESADGIYFRRGEQGVA